MLLSLTASWCRGCDLMDAATYGDPRVADLIREAFVPVRVDTDRRPDVNSRYNLDGWPTTAVLTPSGEILTGSTYLTPDAMLRMLESVRDAMRGRYDELMARAEQAAASRAVPSAPLRYEPDGDAPSWIVSRLFEQEDREYGGFGAGGKFLPVSPLQLALAWHAVAPDDRLAALIVRTLDAFCWRGLFDEVDGGFFRCAANRDFTRPHTEKLLEDQVALVPLLLDAAARFDRPAYRERARDVIRYVHRTLADPEAGFFASQQADDEYYALAGSIRATMEPPRVDRTVFTDLNAQAIVSWLAAARLLGEPELAQRARRTASRVLAAPVTDEGFRHWTDTDALSGLLTDQIHGAWALVHLAAETVEGEYLSLANRVMDVAFRRFWDSRAGGFLDRIGRPGDVGLLRDARKPLMLNSLAARVLARLARMTDQPVLHARAREALGAVTAHYRTEGIGASPYALAVLELAGSPA